MDIRVRENSDIVIIDIDGILTSYESKKIDEIVSENVLKNRNKIIINLDNVSHIDSSGMETLVSIKNNLVDRKGNLCLVNPNNSIKKILDLTKLTKQFSIFSIEDDAVNYFSN